MYLAEAVHHHAYKRYWIIDSPNHLPYSSVHSFLQIKKIKNKKKSGGREMKAKSSEIDKKKK